MLPYFHTDGPEFQESFVTSGVFSVTELVHVSKSKCVCFICWLRAQLGLCPPRSCSHLYAEPAEHPWLLFLPLSRPVLPLGWISPIYWVIAKMLSVVRLMSCSCSRRSRSGQEQHRTLLDQREPSTEPQTGTGSSVMLGKEPNSVQEAFENICWHE